MTSYTLKHSLWFKSGTVKFLILSTFDTLIFRLQEFLLRDSSDLHIYKDLCGKITIVSVTYEM